ncbi:acetylxylan esterase [Candidatus Woesearchaeota archaeon]|nr:acetylxylan esterase [Candidatus Woesearchaeota archaeon]
MKIKKKYLYFGVVVAVILLAVAFYLKPFVKQKKTEEKSKEQDKILWLVDKDGYLAYPLNRGNIKFRRDDYAQTDNLTISRVIYQSTRGNVYGLLVLPKSASELMPGVVLLPGAGVGKESELGLAKKIAELGAAVLTIDQRGTGETGGEFNSIKQDYLDFLNAKEPTQHLMVYDALRGYDLLNSAPFIDPERIIIAGESLGGRIAIIATAIDRNIKGVLAISSSGLDFKETNDTKVNAFLKSIDSDHYIGQITPRKLVMMHNVNDKNIPLNSAIMSYSKAQEPKRFVLVNDTSCNHGYCDSMYNGLVDALDYLVDIRSKTLVSVQVK